jgi:hypothetical protein
MSAKINGYNSAAIFNQPGGPYFKTAAVILKTMHVIDDHSGRMNGHPALSK